MTEQAIDPQDGFGLVRSYTRHLAFVRLAMHHVGDDLARRAIVHDTSKMLDDEFAGFSRINAAARLQRFGSPEYKESMDRERPTINLHFSRNRHHPEREGLLAADQVRDQLDYQNGKPTAYSMTFLDVIEMVCDWWGARKGYDDNNRAWPESVEMNLKFKGPHLTEQQQWLAREVAAFLETLAPDYGR